MAPVGGASKPLPSDAALFFPERMNLEAVGLFRPLHENHPDYVKELQDLTLELNKTFEKWAKEKNLRKKAREWTRDDTGHVAVVGTPYGLHIAFCRRMTDPAVRDAVRAWLDRHAVTKVSVAKV